MQRWYEMYRLRNGSMQKEASYSLVFIMVGICISLQSRSV